MSGLRSNPIRCTTCTIRSRCFFSFLQPDVLDGVANWVHLNPKVTIFHQGAPALGWYILCQSRAKLLLQAAKGKKFLLQFAKPGDILNLTVFGPHAFSAEAVDHCSVGLVERDQIFLLLQQYPELLKEAFRRLSLWEERLVRRVEDLVALGVRERLVRVLLELGEEYGVKEADVLRIDLPLSLRDLAEIVKASPQTTSKELSLLAGRGLIKIIWPTIFLLNLDGLRRRVQ